MISQDLARRMYAALMDARLTTQVAMARATGRDLATYTDRFQRLNALLNEVDRAFGDKTPLHKAPPTLRRRAGKPKPLAPRVIDAESSTVNAPHQEEATS
jgi:predicted nucleic acid-binding Zn ribbon protein